MADIDFTNEPVVSSLRQVVGGLVFSSQTPVSIETIRKILKECPPDDEGIAAPFKDVLPRDVRDILIDIRKDLERLNLGIELQEVAGGYRFQTQPGTGRWIRSLLNKDKPQRLSRTTLETLAIIAYRQPIPKSEIEGIRGVTVDHVVRALMEMHLIRIIGRSELPGRPFLYGTTPLFLEHFGLKSLEELNELDPTLQRSEAASVSKKPKNKEEAAAIRNEKSGGVGGDLGAAAEMASLAAARPSEVVDEKPQELE